MQIKPKPIGKKTSGRGRPYKGKRARFTVRLPIAAAATLAANAEIHGQYINDYIADILLSALKGRI